MNPRDAAFRTAADLAALPQLERMHHLPSRRFIAGDFIPHCVFFEGDVSLLHPCPPIPTQAALRKAEPLA